MQMKTMSYHYTPIRMAKIPNTDNIDAGENMKQHELTAVGDVKWYSYFGRQFGSFLQNWTYSYHAIQELWSMVFTQRSWKLTVTQMPAHVCL